MSRPVIWDGKPFPSISAAARYEGVAVKTMTDWLGLEPKHGARPVTIRGTTYRNLKEAALALGISHEAVRQARVRGVLDKVGLRAKGAVK